MRSREELKELASALELSRQHLCQSYNLAAEYGIADANAEQENNVVLGALDRAICAVNRLM